MERNITKKGNALEARKSETIKTQQLEYVKYTLDNKKYILFHTIHDDNPRKSRHGYVDVRLSCLFNGWINIHFILRVKRREYDSLENSTISIDSVHPFTAVR